MEFSDSKFDDDHLSIGPILLPKVPEDVESQTLYLPQSPTKKSLWRSWKQLSRLQRSVCYMILALLTLLITYNVLQKSSSNSNKFNLYKGNPFRSGDKMNLEQRLENSFNINNNNNHKNKVQKVLEEIKGPVDENQNKAKEVVYEEELEEDEEEEEGKEEDVENKALEEFDVDGGGGGGGPKIFRGPQNQRQRAVVEATKHAWKGYKDFAWGNDHLRPVSRSGQNWFNLGLTIVDSLDTLYIMNLKEEFEEAKEWVRNDLNFAQNKDVNLFETTIRVLGGLLGTFHLSKENIFLEKAKDLGDRLLGAFTSPSGIPYSDVNLRSTKGHAPKWSTDSSTSEVSTIQLEFRDLSRCTGNSIYEEKAESVSKKIHDLPKTDGLVPIYINANTGRFRPKSTITLGARGDSYYEYLLKQWLQTSKTQNYLVKDYEDAIAGVQKHLVRRTFPNNLLFIGEIPQQGSTSFKPKMDELTCFLPGTLALGHHNGLPQSHLRLAEELAYSCYLTWARQPTSLSAEINYFNTNPSAKEDFYVKPNDAHYLLRPETVESFWYLYYLTGNKTYQDWGWKIFQGIEKYTKVRTGGYTTIGNVRNPVDLKPRDMMESFLLGETFKYLYLLFADNHEFDLDQWVFNTEAHPLPILNDS